MNSEPDYYGITYSSNYEVLRSCSNGKPNVVIKSSAKSIYGVSISDNAFSECRSVLESFTFEPNPKLFKIGNYSFSKCSKLQSVDLRPCTELRIISSFAFSGCSATSILLPEGVVELGAQCFSYTRLESFSLPNSVLTIPDRCFMECSKLSSFNIDFQSQLQSIESIAFYKTIFREITLTNNVISIRGSFHEGSSIETFNVSPDNKVFKIVNNAIVSKNGENFYAFPPKRTGTLRVPDNIISINYASCIYSEVTTVILPSSVTSIGSYAFAHSQVRTINLPPSLKSLADHCLYNCRLLESIEIPDSVTSISESAFQNCITLTTVKLPAFIKTIERYVFKSCKISSITIPATVITIRTESFLGCQISEVELPDNLSTLEGNAFEPTTKLRFSELSKFYIDSQYLIIDKENTTVAQYIGLNEDHSLSILSSVTTIKASAFYNKYLLSEIRFEWDSRLNKIEDKAFYNCQNLVFVRLPSSIVSIGESAFYQCNLLHEINLNQVTSLSKKSFLNCRTLGTVNIESSTLSVLLESTFSGCQALQTINLPFGLSAIDEECFFCCISLTSVKFPNTIESIGKSAFMNCGLSSIDMSHCTMLTVIPENCFLNNQKLSNFVFPPNCERIGIRSFQNTSITNVSIPPSLVTISNYAFDSCSSIKKFEIPSNSMLDTIGIGAFNRCFSISEIESLSDKFRIFTGALFNRDLSSLIMFPPASNITYFSLPSDTKSINGGAFYGCRNLISVMIPSGSVTRISVSAFEDCTNLAWINLPLSVEFVDVDAFSGCTKLSCGVKIESKNSEFRKKLVTDSKLNPQALKECNGMITCRSIMQPTIPYFYLFPFILM